jgi:nucleotide-binding universal stress UspA family protein
MNPVIVVAYNATEEAADGLTLGRLLAELQRGHLFVAPVFPHIHSSEVTERETQRHSHEEVAATHAEAARVLGDDAFELWPIFGETVADGIQALAAERGADLIVFGSAEHGPIGRVLLGSSAEEAVHGAPCAVAVAPHGLRKHPHIAPNVVGVAFDGSPESIAALNRGHALARAAGAALRVIAVEPSVWTRPIHRNGSIAEALAHHCEALGNEVVVEHRLLHGDPASELTRETHQLGMLVCGSRGVGPLRRVMLGSVSAAVMRSASCPLIVVPRGALEPPLPAAATPPSASTHR